MLKVNQLKSLIKRLHVVDEVAAGFSLIDRDFRIVWVNATHIKWFAKTRNIIGKHCYKIYEGRNDICVGCPCRRSFKTGKTYKALRPGILEDGRKGLFQVIANPIKDKKGNVIQVLELVYEVTDRVRLSKQHSSKITSLKSICGKLKSSNKKLNVEIKRMRSVSKKVSSGNDTLNKRYRTLLKRLNYKQEELHDLVIANKLVCSNGDTAKAVSLIAKLAKDLLHADAASVRYVDNESRMLVPKTAIGLGKNMLMETPLKIGEGIEGRAAASGKVFICNDMQHDDRVLYPDKAKEEHLRSALVVPAAFKQQNLAVFSVFYRHVKQFSDEEIELIKAFSNQIAVAIQENKNYDDVHKNYFSTLRALVLAMEARDPYTRGHSERVTMYALDIARKLKLPDNMLRIIHYGGTVHDVGKVGISDLILNKPGRLTAVERSIIELHPIKGAKVLQPLKFMKQCIPLVRNHHERFDGDGYPDRIAETEIPLSARILACADSFDAMTSDRPYRLKKMTVKDAIKELRVNAGLQFDPKIVPVFVSLINKNKYI
ncbi:MAG: GAF domain-containing protein [Candidatus Omnitrophica bacterium]|nr:GAF domain-containing protein [Candidatus Omnitrophota bacterium]